MTRRLGPLRALTLIEVLVAVVVCGAGIAVVATAHYLVRVMLAMLRTGELWRGEAA